MSNQSHIDYILHLSDSTLILAQRNSEWCAHGPILEQDIAITNISLDLLGQARNFYQHAANLISNPAGNITEDTLAYLRTEREFKNLLITELPNGDWAQTILRQFFFIFAQSVQTITGQQGTQVTFSNDVLLKPDGQVATGNVIIELKEIYRKSDMLYANKPTVTVFGPLKSGGEVFLKARLEETGEELQIVPDTTPQVNILFPAAAPLDSMFGFIQGTDSAGNFVWNPMGQGWATPAFPTAVGYVIQTDTLTWNNCDRPIFSDPWVKFTMNANDPPAQYLTDVFLFFPEKTMIHVYKSSASGFSNIFTPCKFRFHGGRYRI